MKKALIWTVVGLFVASFVYFFAVGICGAEGEWVYPCGMERVSAIAMHSDTEIVPGVSGVEMIIPDYISDDNPGGKILLACGFGKEHGVVGVDMGILTKEGYTIIEVAVYYFPEEQVWSVVNLTTGEEDTITEKTACEFVDQWLKLYDKALGGELI